MTIRKWLYIKICYYIWYVIVIFVRCYSLLFFIILVQNQ